MDDGRREVEVRLSMAYYFIKRMNLDLPDLPATRVQICIENIDEVDAAIAAAREEGEKGGSPRGCCGRGERRWRISLPSYRRLLSTRSYAGLAHVLLDTVKRLVRYGNGWFEKAFALNRQVNLPTFPPRVRWAARQSSLARA